MSQGRSNIRQPRAPAAAMRRGFRGLSRVTEPTADAFRIGPCLILSARQWHERGVRHEQAGEYESAIRCYRAALSIDPSDTQVLFDLAYTLAEVGKMDAAIERYWQITEIEPARQDAWVNLGDLLITAGHDEEGIAALRRAVQLDPSDVVARQNLASSLATTEL